MKMSTRYIFLTDLDSIHNKLSSDYSLNILFSCCCPCTDRQSFSQYKPLQIVHLWKVNNIPIFFGNCTYLLNSGEKFEDVFLFNIANK